MRRAGRQKVNLEKEPREEGGPVEIRGRTIRFFKTLGGAARDKEAQKIFLRTGVNAAATAAEFIPFVGNIPSWLLDFLKMFEGYDSTPDVPKWVAWGTELFEGIELSSGIPVPTHAIETTMQLKVDVPRMIEIVKSARDQADQGLGDYQANEGDIRGAMDVFGMGVPVMAGA